MIERRRGHLVTIGSIAGRIGSPFEAIYSATKFAGVGLTEALAVELEPYGDRRVAREPRPGGHRLRRRAGPSLRPGAAQAGARRGGGPGRRPGGRGRAGRELRARRRSGRRWPSATWCRPCSGGAPGAASPAELARGSGAAVRALVFGTTPEPWTPPPGANQLTRNLASPRAPCSTSPTPEPLRPDWVVIRPRLTGICGSDAKQVLLDFEGDSDSAMSGLCSFPQVLGHEVVAEVVELGPAGRGLRGRPARRAQPVAVVRAPRRRPASARRARPAT